MNPDYCKKKTLAKRLDLPEGAIDQLVARGLLPPPIKLGEALLWKWDAVDSFLSSRKAGDVVDDPYDAGARRAAEAAATRSQSQKPFRA